jgi:hypothetical protein
LSRNMAKLLKLPIGFSSFNIPDYAFIQRFY